MTQNFSNPLPGIPTIESPFFEEIADGLNWDAETRRIATDLHTNGFAILDFPDEHFSDKAEKIKAALHARYVWDEWLNNGVSLRIQDAWTFDKNVYEIAINQKIIDLLSTLYGKQAWPFQTLNFPVGTQQHFHSDTVHFHSIPERFMCGVWVALEDIDESCGPLIYYPGSHRWPVLNNEHLEIAASQLSEHPGQALYEPAWVALAKKYNVQPVRFMPKKGQALVWLANLLHGGDIHRDKKRTRWSQVTHYFFDECAYYTPMFSDPVLGKIAFRSMHNVCSRQIIHSKYAGIPIDDNDMKVNGIVTPVLDTYATKSPHRSIVEKTFSLSRRVKKLLNG